MSYQIVEVTKVLFDKCMCIQASQQASGSVAMPLPQHYMMPDQLLVEAPWQA